MTEFLKGYAAGANDMEAGRLVTKNSAVDFVIAQVRDRDLVIESLREQHKTLGDHAANMERLLEAAEAKLAEVEANLSNEREARWEVERILNKSVTSRKAAEKRLAEVETTVKRLTEINGRLGRNGDKLQAKLAEAEKELEELRKGDT